jgi:hypothetical protein
MAGVVLNVVTPARLARLISLNHYLCIRVRVSSSDREGISLALSFQAFSAKSQQPRAKS